MSVKELEEGYEQYMEQIARFYEMDKIELALMLARLCVLEPHLPEQIEREMTAIKVVKNYAKQVIEEKHGNGTKG